MADDASNLVIVTNVLPAAIVRNEDGTYTAVKTPVDNSSIFRYSFPKKKPKHTTGFEGVKGFEQVLYVGCPNIYVPDDDAERSAVELACAEINCCPVFLTQKQGHEHYQVRPY